MIRSVALVVVVACLAPALAQDTDQLFDLLASKNEQEAAAAMDALVALGEELVPEIERRLAKKPAVRVAVRLATVLKRLRAGQPPALLTPRLKLPRAAPGLPAVISPDGKRVVYAVKHQGKGWSEHQLTLGLLDRQPERNKSVRTVQLCGYGGYMTSTWLAAALRPGCWSPDSKRLGFVTAGYAKQPQTSVGFFNLDAGSPVVLGEGKGELHLGLRFHPQGGQVAWCKVVPKRDRVSGTVELHDLERGRTRSLKLPKGLAPAAVSYLDDGRLLVLGVEPEHALPGKVRARVCLVGTDGKTVERLDPEVRPDESQHMGLNLLCAGDVLLCESRADEGKPSALQRFAFGGKTPRGEVVATQRGCSVQGLFGPKLASVWDPEAKKAGLLDLTNGELTQLDHTRVLVHCRGTLSVIRDMATGELHMN